MRRLMARWSVEGSSAELGLGTDLSPVLLEKRVFLGGMRKAELDEMGSHGGPGLSARRASSGTMGRPQRGQPGRGEEDVTTTLSTETIKA